MFLQGLDNLYLLVYPSWLALAITLLAGGLSERGRRLGFTLAWLVLLAIPLDLAENYALLQQLQHDASSGWAGLALACAVPKFTLVVLGFGGMLVLGLARILQRLGSS